MSNESQEVLDRLAGRERPLICPHCGEPLHQIYSAEPSIEWNEKTREYVQSSYFGEAPKLCCGTCDTRLDDDLAREILEGL